MRMGYYANRGRINKIHKYSAIEGLKSACALFRAPLTCQLLSPKRVRRIENRTRYPVPVPVTRALVNSIPELER